MFVIQAWGFGHVQLASRGRVRRRTLKKILITNSLHSLRSQQADAAIAEAEAKYSLPDGARAGGNMDADPNSQAEVHLTRSAHVDTFIHVYVSAYLLVSFTQRNLHWMRVA